MKLTFYREEETETQSTQESRINAVLRISEGGQRIKAWVPVQLGQETEVSLTLTFILRRQ
jgi:hypothetical protein